MKQNSTIKITSLTSIVLMTTLFNANTLLAGETANAKAGGLSVYNSDDKEEKYWFKVNGQIKADNTYFFGDTRDTRRPPRVPDTNFVNGANLRAAELNFSGGLGKDLSFALGFSTGGNEIEIEDAYLEYKGLAKNVIIKVGQVPMPYGFENTTSAKWISFLERSLPTVDFSSTFRLGALVTVWNEMFSANVAFTQPKFAARLGTDNDLPIIGKRDNLGMASRFIFSPVHTSEGGYHKAYHFSIGIRYQDAVTTDIFGRPFRDLRFRTRPEARTRHTPFILDTGPFVGKYYMVYSGEAAYISGPLTLQGEYGLAHVERPSPLHNVDFSGWYVQASYILTGESRVYNYPTGTLGRIIPKSPCGAWEVAVRHSYLNLNSFDINGGVGHNTGVSLGWYADNNIRIMGNYIYSKQHPRGERKRIIHILGMRFQVVF